jgi:hypothetical protein
MLNLCGIVATILKMATARNCSMSGINSGHHNLYRNQIPEPGTTNLGFANNQKERKN